MNWTTIAWSMGASACLTLAIVHLVIWCKQTDQPAHLLFSVTAISGAAIAAAELLIMHAQSPEQLGRVIWWAHIPVFFLFASIVGFVRVYFNAGRAWLGYAVCGLRLLEDVIINFFSVPNVNYVQITGLRHLRILGGETISLAQGVENPWVRISELSSLLFLVFVVDASVTLWRRGHPGERRRAVIVGGSMILFILVAAGTSALIEAGVMQSPYLISFSFLAIVAAMGYELSSDVVRAAQLARKLQESDVALRESEQNMALAASAAELAMWMWDIPRDEVWITDKGRALFGFAQSDKINFDRFLDVVHPEDRNTVRRARGNAVDGAGEYESEYRVVLPGGQARWIVGRGRVEFSCGKPVRMRGVSFDITRRKQAEEHFELLVEASPNAMLLMNTEGKINLANAQVEAVFGYTRQELVGHSVEMLIPERFRSQHPSYRNSYFSDPKARAMGAGRELYGRRKDDGEVPIEIGLTPIRTSEGLFVLASIIDITERKQAEMEAARQRNELAHHSRVMLLGELSGSLAHELNQPLGAIVTNAGAALRSLERDKMTPEKFREVLEDIVADGRRAGDVIRSIKGMLRKVEGTRQLVNLDNVITQTLRLTQADALAHDCTVLTEFRPALSKVQADVVQLQQVFLNLILNAFEASKDVPKLQRRVIISTERDGDGAVRACVRDFGAGLPAEASERIFEQFFSTKREGMGMGLFISRSIVAAHGGTLCAKNAEGGGAQFWLRLPASKEMNV
jgi:two-component system, LuxR family, sensor kinase FixL